MLPFPGALSREIPVFSGGLSDQVGRANDLGPQRVVCGASKFRIRRPINCVFPRGHITQMSADEEQMRIMNDYDIIPLNFESF